MADLRDLKSCHFASDNRPAEPGWLAAGSDTDSRKVIHIAGLGDVGRTMAIGLVLEGGDIVERIGLFDLNPDQCRRMAIELSQISYPCGGRRTPEVVALAPGPEENSSGSSPLFDCDVFLFCATKAVPEVGSGVGDVRMAQYEANRGIVALYAQQATKAGFKGLFGVVSDPVELLCRAALTASEVCAAETNAAPADDTSSAFWSRTPIAPLSPDQIQGFGMGVMYARASYYARKRLAENLRQIDAGDDIAADFPVNIEAAAEAGALTLFPKEGRVFGQHGQELVVANSTVAGNYDDELSRELTALTVQANKEVRALGFKPFIAPAMSSAALTILAVIRGDWTDSAVFLNGIYFGVRSRVRTAEDTGKVLREIEPVSACGLPDDLFARIQTSYQAIDKAAAG